MYADARKLGLNVAMLTITRASDSHFGKDSDVGSADG